MDLDKLKKQLADAKERLMSSETAQRDIGIGALALVIGLYLLLPRDSLPGEDINDAEAKQYQLIKDAKKYSNETSRNGKRKYMEKTKLRDEFISSLEGKTFRGECYFEYAFRHKEVKFSGIIFTRKQVAETYPYWSIECSEHKDGRGSSYNLSIHDSFLTEEERELIESVEEGDEIAFSGIAYRVTDKILFNYWKKGRNDYGMNFDFSNRIWDDEKTPEVRVDEKTIFIKAL